MKQNALVSKYSKIRLRVVNINCTISIPIKKRKLYHIIKLNGPPY